MVEKWALSSIFVLIVELDYWYLVSPIFRLYINDVNER